jgi:hypothetical protein
MQFAGQTNKRKRAENIMGVTVNVCAVGLPSELNYQAIVMPMTTGSRQSHIAANLVRH